MNIIINNEFYFEFYLWVVIWHNCNTTPVFPVTNTLSPLHTNYVWQRRILTECLLWEFKIKSSIFPFWSWVFRYISYFLSHVYFLQRICLYLLLVWAWQFLVLLAFHSCLVFQLNTLLSCVDCFHISRITFLCLVHSITQHLHAYLIWRICKYTFVLLLIHVLKTTLSQPIKVTT